MKKELFNLPEKDWVSIYDSPIFGTIGQLQTEIIQDHDRQILKAVQNIGIDIDKDALIQALQNDRKRYEDAYDKGYNDCKRYYKGLISKMRELIQIAEEGGDYE